MFHPIRSNNPPSKRNNLHHPRDIVVPPSLHVRYAGNLKRRPVVWSSPLPSLHHPILVFERPTEFRFDSARGTRLDVHTTCPHRRHFLPVEALEEFLLNISPSRGEDGKIQEEEKKKEEVKEQETRGGRGKKHAMSSSAKRREGIATSISHQEPTLLSLSLSHSFPLDKEASMNWSGVLDNLIKGRLPSLATAGPSHPLCDSLAPFCHP